MEKISVIIPIYNSEKHLSKCLNSVINQSYSNLEIILINDGSLDNSEKICLNYKSKDNRIVYIYKENSGVSNTRNMGVKKSTGEYIIFIDSDDYIDLDYIDILYNNIKRNNVDIVVSGLTEVDDNYNMIGKLYYDTKKNVLNFVDYIDIFINYSYFTCVKMLIKKEIIKNNFNSELDYGEDMLFAYNLLSVNKICYITNCGYYYVQNNNSVTHNETIEAMDKYMSDTYSLFLQILSDFPEKKDVIYHRMFTKLNIASQRLCRNGEIKYKDIKKFIISYFRDYNFNNVSLKKIKYVSFLNKLRLLLLRYKMYYFYFMFNRLIKIIKDFKYRFSKKI